MGDDQPSFDDLRDLGEEARTGGDEAFRKLVMLFLPLLRKTIYAAYFSGAGDASLVDEACDHAFVQFRLHPPQIRGCAIRWLVRVARRKAIDILKREGRWLKDKRPIEEAANRAVDEEQQKRTARRVKFVEAMERVIPKLPAQDQVIALRKLEGKPDSEIAKELGISEEAVRQRFFRLRPRLERELRNEGYEPE